MDDVVVDVEPIGEVENWLAILIARELETRVSTEWFLKAFNVKWEAYGLVITTSSGHFARLVILIYYNSTNENV